MYLLLILHGHEKGKVPQSGAYFPCRAQEREGPSVFVAYPPMLGRGVRSLILNLAHKKTHILEGSRKEGGPSVSVAYPPCFKGGGEGPSFWCISSIGLKRERGAPRYLLQILQGAREGEGPSIRTLNPAVLTCL